MKRKEIFLKQIHFRKISFYRVNPSITRERGHTERKDDHQMETIEPFTLFSYLERVTVPPRYKLPSTGLEYLAKDWIIGKQEARNGLWLIIEINQSPIGKRN